MNVDKIENRTLKITVVANLVMAIAGWVTYNLTDSQAMLLDGNFSFILAIATFVAIYISKNKHKKSATFPFGNYVYEAAFVLSKGVLILGIIIMAVFQNAIKILDYFQGVKEEPIVLEPIYYYTAFILVLSFGLMAFFNVQNKRVNNQSSLLLVEKQAVKVDAILTAVTGLVFFLLSFIDMGTKLDIFLYLGDSIIVVVLCIFMITSPLSIIINAFIELGGGTIQNKEEKQQIEATIKAVVSNEYTFESFISKIGSGYLFVVYINPIADTIHVDDFKLIRQRIKDELKDCYPAIYVETTLIS
jgi:predicted Co/Zn/Cd cation transporter (cation efflux family)